MARFLEWLEQRGTGPAPSILLVAAHPDDEVLGASTVLARLPQVQLLHVTDGAPRNLCDARAAGFAGWQDYARARRAELREALAIAGVPAERAQVLGLPDQDVSFRLVELAQALAARCAQLGPEVVLTHPYEGGHPDHDGCAFAVHAACSLLRRRGWAAPVIVEMTSYHAGPDGLVTGEFLEDSRLEVLTLALDPAERALKRRLIDCFTTQRRVLAAFPVGAERFRPAPAYDFTRAPHEGRLFYENFDWGIDSEGWRALAGEALAELRVLQHA